MEDHWVKTLVNSMSAKIIAFLILGLLIIAVSIGLFTNKHVKIFGIEFNDIANSTTIKHDTINVPYIKHDTIYNKKTEIAKRNDNSHVFNPITKNEKANKYKDTEKVTKKDTAIVSQKNVNNGNNYGSIGDNNRNFFGKIKQHPNERLLHEVDSTYPNKEELIQIMAVTTGAGSADFANELADLMKQLGFKKVSVGVTQMSPIPKKGITVDNRFGGKRLLVNVD